MKSLVYYFSNSSIFKSSLIFIISSVLNSAVPFILLPIIIKNLSANSIGVISIFQIIVGILTPIIGLSTNGALSVKYFKYDKEKLNSFIKSSLILISISFLIVVVFFYLFYERLYSSIKFPIQFIYLPILFVYCQAINNILFSLLQNRDEPVKFGLINLLYTSLNLGLSLFFILSMHLDWKGRIFGQSFSILLLALFTIYYLKKNNYLDIKSKINLIDVLSFGLPLIPNYLISSFSSYWGHLTINRVLDTSELGVYSVYYQYSSVLLIVTNSINLAYSPWLMKKLNEKVIDKIKIVKSTYLYFSILLILYIVFCALFFVFERMLLGNLYLSNYTAILFFLSLSFIFNGMHMIVVNYIFYVEKVYYVTIISIFNFLIVIGLNYALIDDYGIMGAAVAQLMTSILSFFFVWKISSHLYKMPWFDKSLWH